MRPEICISQKLLGDAAAGHRPHIKNSKGPVSPGPEKVFVAGSMGVGNCSVIFPPAFFFSYCVFSVAGPFIWASG